MHLFTLHTYTFSVSPKFSPVHPAATNIVNRKPYRIPKLKKTCVEPERVSQEEEEENLKFTTKTLEALGPYDVPENKILTARYKDNMNKILFANTNMELYHEVMQTCLFLEEDENMSSVTGSDMVFDVNLGIEPGSVVKFKALVRIFNNPIESKSFSF